MAKTKTDTALVVSGQDISSSPNVRTDEFGSADEALAQEMGVALAGAIHVRLERAVVACNEAVRQMTEAGLLLSSVRAEVGAEHFVELLADRGMSKQRAYELMRGAALVARLPADQRHQVLALSKTKVLALAHADPAVVEAMLDDDEVSIDLLSVRDLRQRIRDLEAGMVDVQTQRDTAEAELEAARQQLAKQPGDREDKVPVVVAGIRAELLVLQRKAVLALESMRGTVADLARLAGADAAQWLAGTGALAFAAVAEVQLQLNALTQDVVDLPGGVHGAEDTPLARLSNAEAQEWQGRLATLTAVHQYEADLRATERHNAATAGQRGRPRAMPKAPAGVKSAPAKKGAKP